MEDLIPTEDLKVADDEDDDDDDEKQIILESELNGKIFDSCGWNC